MSIVAICVQSMLCYVTTINSTAGMYDAISMMHNLSKRTELDLLKLRYQKDKFELCHDMDLREAMDTQIFYSVNSALHNIQSAVDIAEEQDKDRESCYSTARDTLLEHTIETFNNGIYECLDTFRKAYIEKLESIEIMIKKFQFQLDKLNDVLITCMGRGIRSSIENDMKACFYVRIAKITKALTKLETEMASIKIEEDSPYSTELQTFKDCIRPHALPLDDFAFRTEHAGVQCANKSD